MKSFLGNFAAAGLQDVSG